MSIARGVGLPSGTPPNQHGGTDPGPSWLLGSRAGGRAVCTHTAARGPGGFLATGITLGMLVTAWACNVIERPEHHTWPAVGWLPSIIAMSVASVALWRTSAMPELARGATRFWRQYAVVLALGALALVVRAAGAVGETAATAEAKLPVGTVVLSSASVGLAIWALLLVPVGRLTRGAWIRLVLDLLTVVLGAAMVMWYATLSKVVVEPANETSVWGPLTIGGLCLVGLAALVKIALVGSGPVDLGALRLLGGSLLAGGISAGTASLVTANSTIVPGQVAVPVVATLVALAARRQAVVARGGTARLRSRRTDRQYSLLPYVAVLATDVLLVLVTYHKIDLKGAVVVGGVIVITGVVAIRQLVAFADNTRLVRQLRGQEDRLRHQAAHDALTQLANRTLFTERLDAALAAWPAPRLAVLLVDLDDFKSVNDTLGHAVGDRLLVAVARRLKRCIRSHDTVARLGGDEFGVLLHGVDPAEADATAARILASLAVPVITTEHSLLIRASIGVAIATPDDDSGKLLRNADIAMYAAKGLGKGAHLRYVPGMATNVLEHAQLGAQLREAIDGGELYPVFQPVMHLTEHYILGVETLVRWRHRAKGIVTPADFIQTAERTGLVVPMGRWLLLEACTQLAAWKRAYGRHAPATIGVNVSGRQLTEPDFPAFTASALRHAGLEPHNLVLEVTEDSVLTGGHVRQTLQALHDLGVMIALDDFGTGQSSLGVLRACPVDILKLDKSFVDGIGRGTQQAAIATAVFKMAQAMGLDAVAEGIEERGQLEFLLGIGYYLGQGFHLALPMPAGEVSRLFGQPTVTAAYRQRPHNGHDPFAASAALPLAYLQGG